MRRYAHAVITGARGQLGLALARELISHQIADTLSLCSRSAMAESELLALAGTCQVAVYFDYFDLQDHCALQAFLRRCQSRCPVELLILNAGVSLSNTSWPLAPDRRPPAAFALEDEGEIKRAFATNAIAPALAALYTVRTHLQSPAAGRGQLQLVAISSLAALAPLSSPLYSATKSALSLHMLALGRQLRPYGVGVTVVLPGFIRSAMSDRFAGRKPGMISAPQAARRIIRGVRQARPLIAFPWYLYWGLKLLSICPCALQDLLLRPFAFEVLPERGPHQGQPCTSPSASQSTAPSRSADPLPPLASADPQSPRRPP